MSECDTMSECESAENARYLEKIYNVSKSVTRGRSSGDSTLSLSTIYLCTIRVHCRPLDFRFVI
jgi:hypothetical protein